MVRIFVDADACPVKDEVVKIAQRHQVDSFMVSNGGLRPYRNPHVKMVIVEEGIDAADNWIIDEIGNGDIAVTSDMLLAERCVDAGALVLKPNGNTIDEKNIGALVGTRNLMTELRNAGKISGGTRIFRRQDRSNFASSLERAVYRLGNQI